MASPRRRHLLRELVDEFAEHRLFIYATSIGFRALIALVPVVLLALGLFGALGLQQTWRKSVEPQLRPHLTPSVFHAIDDSAARIMRTGTAPLIVFATVLVLLDLALAIAAISDRACDGYRRCSLWPRSPSSASSGAC